MSDILLPSVGRKVALTRMFRAAAHPRGLRVVAADLSPRAAGLYAADEAELLPAFDAPEYWDAVAALLRRRSVAAVVPTRDAELAAWAERAEADAHVERQGVGEAQLQAEAARLADHAAEAEARAAGLRGGGRRVEGEHEGREGGTEEEGEGSEAAGGHRRLVAREIRAGKHLSD